MRENVHVKEFNVMGRIALSTVEFDIVKNWEIKTKKNNIRQQNNRNKNKIQYINKIKIQEGQKISV